VPRGNTRGVSAPAALLALSLLAAGLSAGCGTSDRETDAATTVERFQRALEDGDGELACEQLSEDTRSRLEQQERDPCAEAIFGLELPAGRTAARTAVYVTSASVTLDDGGTLFLNEAASGWEIAAAGCQPTAPDLPYVCELES
jgi:hypothetical protein